MYNVGDTVKVFCNKYGHNYVIGGEYIIRALSFETGCYYLGGEGSCYVKDDEIELVKRKGGNAVKSDLYFQIGDTIIYRDKEFIVGCILPEKGYFLFSNYSEFDGRAPMNDGISVYPKDFGCQYSCYIGYIGIDYSYSAPTVKLKQKKEDLKMLKCIINNFPKTEDAVLVEKYASVIGITTDTFLSGLTVSQNKEALLNEAKRLEAEAIERTKASK